jgi:predicted dehydrogenase
MTAMVRIGIVGIGFMGMIHFLAWQRVRGSKVTAIATRDAKKRAGDWREIKGNFGPPGTQMDLAGVKAHAELDALLADPQVDLVDLCLPPDLHADAAVAAFKAGKHVLCEKPIALTTADADRMVRAAQKAGKLLLIAHVLPFFPEYAFARQAIASGKHGRLLGGHFKRIISDPTWLADFYDPRKVGGPVIDLHIHDAHFIRLVCGMPRAVFSRGRMRGEVVEFVNTQFLFEDDALAVTAASGVIQQQGRAFTHAYEIYLERATLLFDFAVIGPDAVVAMPVTVLDHRGKVVRPQLGSGDPVDAFAAEMAEAARSVKSGRPSPLLDGSLARDALLLCAAQNKSVTSGKLVKL